MPLPGNIRADGNQERHPSRPVSNVKRVERDLNKLASEGDARAATRSLRSDLMSRIRGQHTEPELILRRMLWNAAFRYRLHLRIEGIRPDLVLTAQRVAVFVDGCFWHGCPEHYVRPRSRTRFWGSKLVENVRRDRRQTRLLESMGWKVLRFWEHELFEDPEGVVEAIRRTATNAYRCSAEWRVTRVEILCRDGSRERRHMEDLRDERKRRIVVQARSTRKWRR